MLHLVLSDEYYDEANNLFVKKKEQALQLEHSLVSISKWEAKWRKPFLAKGPKTLEETIDYIRCMTITQNVKPDVYSKINDTAIEKVKEYIAAPMTATWFSKGRSGSRQRIMTSERIYSLMISLDIPFECQKWHLNRLLTLIQVCSIENVPRRKMSKNEIYKSNCALNNARRNKLHSKG